MAEKDMTREERAFAAEIRAEREKRSWTQQDLANQMRDRGLTYVNQTTVSRIEGLSRPVRLMEAQVLSQIFQRTVRSLTMPDDREHFLEIVETNYRARMKAFLEQRDLLAAVAAGQIYSESERVFLDRVFPDPIDDPATQSKLNEIRVNLSNFAGRDLLADASDTIRSSRERASAEDAEESGALRLLYDPRDWTSDG